MAVLDEATAPPGGPVPTRSRWVDALLLALAYAAVSRLVIFVTSFDVGSGSVFWPGAGLTFAVLVLRPRGWWPALLVGVAVAEVAVDLSAGFGLPLALGWAVANTAEPAVGAYLVGRVRAGRPDLADISTTLRFLWGGVLIGPAVGAIIGTVAAVVLVGDPWWPRLGRWFLGDAIGVLVIAPALLTVRRGAWPGAARQWGSALLFVVVVAAVLGPWSPAAAYGLPYLVIPMLAVVSLRLGLPGACLGLALVAAVVELSAALGFGPFIHAGLGDPLLLSALFLAIAAAAALLVAALTAALVERTRAETQLRHEALTDSLTGLANRRLLDDRLALAARRRPGPERLAVVVIDLDGLKQVNDRFGHDAGDALIMAAGERLLQAVRPSDTVARVGGDEFVTLCDDLPGDGDEARLLGERMLEAVCVPLAWRGLLIPVSASFGVAVNSGATVDPDSLLRRADAAMYRAKRAGGGVAVAGTAELYPSGGGTAPK